MKKFIITLIILLGFCDFSFCQAPVGSIQLLLLSGDKVTYNGNGNTGGTAPVDSTNYTPGSSVTVLGNTGSLVKTDFIFTGWNTAANESGIAYPVGSNFSMGSSTVTLYAIWKKSSTNSIGMTFNLIPNGTFSMGSPTGEPGSNSASESQHDVTLTQSFYMQTTEVTQGQWQAVMVSLPSDISSHTYGQGANYPIYYVTWFDSLIFCNELSIDEGKTPVYYSDAACTVAFTGSPPVTTGTVYTKSDANGYRLPTDAQWEYACRAGTTTAFANGGITYTESSPLDPNLDAIGWYGGNNGTIGTPSYISKIVAQKQANAWGLYDMHGNIFEYCSDWWQEDLGSIPVTDPTGPGTMLNRVVRSGGWHVHAKFCRSAYRDPTSPGIAWFSIGFRVLLPLAANSTYSVYYYGNGNTGGTVPVDSTNYTQGDTVTVLGNTGSLVKIGATFIGWNTAADGSGTSYTAGNTFNIGTANVVLHARWACSVAYNGNGNTGGTAPVDSTDYTPGATAQVRGNTGNLVKTGFLFYGWNSAANGSGTDYPVASYFIVNSDMTLYAKWVAALTFTFVNHTGQRLAAYLNGMRVGDVEIGQTVNFENNPPGSYMLKAWNFSAGYWETGPLNSSFTWHVGLP